MWKKITNIPIIGHLIHNNKETLLVVPESPKSSISESFRSVRTNIQYLTKGKSKQTVLVTSDMVGAGKTFAAMNLAAIFAMYEKKDFTTRIRPQKAKDLSRFWINQYGRNQLLSDQQKPT